MTPAIASSPLLPALSPALPPDAMPARRDVSPGAAVSPATSPPTEATAARPVPAVAAAEETGAARDDADARKDLEALRESLRGKPVDAQYSVDPDTKLVVVKLVSRANGEVIRQIPSEEVVRIAAAIDRMQGVLLDHSA